MFGAVWRVTLGSLVCLATLVAQEAAIRVQTKLVEAPVSVTSPDGRFVEGLTARDFRVLDDGVERHITADVFDGGAARISLVIAIQTSAVPALALETIRRIGGMIQPLVIGRRGEAAVVTFDSEIAWVRDFTGNPVAIRQAVENVEKGSPLEAHLYDAVAAAADRLRDRDGRKVLLLISDDRDRGSSAKLDDAVDAVERAGIEVFAAHYAPNVSAWGSKPKGPDAIRALTEATGGRDYPFMKEGGIEKAIEDFGVEIHSQYILSFPQGADSAGRHQIVVAAPNRGGVRLRWRQAYWTDEPK